VERFCRDLCEHPGINVVIVCHDKQIENDGRVEVLPWTGTSNTALGGKLMSMVDVIGYTGIIEQEGGKKVYAATLLEGGGRKGGDRFASLGKWQPLHLSNWVDLCQDLPDELPSDEGETEPAIEPEEEKVAA
jgi:hypothetical protein